MAERECLPAQTHSTLLAAIARGDTGKLIAHAVSEERARRQQGGASNVHAPPRASIIADHELNWPGTPQEVHAALLQHAAVMYYQGRSPLTYDGRSSVVRQYLYCCGRAGVIAFPVSQHSCVVFSAWCSTRVRIAGIKHYISHLRSYSTECDIKMPLNADMPYLLQMWDGIAKHEALYAKNELRMPLHWSLLVRLLKGARARAGKVKYDRRTLFSMQCPIMKSAVYLLAFCGALRPSEISERVTSEGTITPPLRIKHLRRESKTSNGGVDAYIVDLQKRKNAQFGGAKCQVSIGRTHQRDCPVDAIDEWLAARAALGETFEDGEGLLLPVWDEFVKNYVPLSYEALTAALDEDLKNEGLSSAGFNGYSFRIGAATSMSLNGVPDYWIRELGGWGKNSQAYLTYLQLTPFEKRAEMTTYLTRSYAPKPDEMVNYWDRAQRRAEVSSAMEVPALAPEATAAPAAGTHAHKRGRTHA